VFNECNDSFQLRVAMPSTPYLLLDMLLLHPRHVCRLVPLERSLVVHHGIDLRLHVLY
jgi:hypothetical protein